MKGRASTQLATIRRQKTLDTEGMIAARFGSRRDGRWVQQLDWKVSDDPIVALRQLLLLLKDVQLEQRLVEIRVVFVGDVDVANDIDVDVVGAVAAHGRVVAGRICSVHSGHQVATGSVEVVVASSATTGTSAA